jgi:hypothetical protein
MSDIFHQVLSEPILLGTIVLAVFVNLAALGFKWERERKMVFHTPKKLSEA